MNFGCKIIIILLHFPINNYILKADLYAQTCILVYLCRQVGWIVIVFKCSTLAEAIMLCLNKVGKFDFMHHRFMYLTMFRKLTLLKKNH